MRYRLLPVPVYRQTDFNPKRGVVSRFNDTVAKFRTGVKFSLRYKNRVNSRRCDSRLRLYDILLWYHVKKYRATKGNRSELAPAQNAPVLCQCCGSVLSLVYIYFPLYLTHYHSLPYPKKGKIKFKPRRKQHNINTPLCSHRLVHG